jgi:hypothetical protein
MPPAMKRGTLLLLLAALGVFAVALARRRDPVIAGGGKRADGRESLLVGGAPKALAVDGHFVYVADASGVVRAVDVRGQRMTTLTTVEGASFRSGDLATDGRDVYIVDRRRERVLRVPKDGGSAEMVGAVTKPSAIRARGREGRFCVLGEHALFCAPERGAPLRAVGPPGDAAAFALDGDDVYVSSGELDRVPVQGGEPARVASLACTDLTTDATHVYCATHAGVRAVDKASQAVSETLASGDVARIFAGERVAYASLAGTLNVRTAPKHGGNARSFLEVPDATSADLALHDAHLYFSVPGAVYRMTAR